ncbi:hypothetical protein [Kordiimonas aquimaris]|uniref:hypothetical protein n=1 Tax=Kordiimonas aquimaris TaxID=707591 RepID=UPI0021D10936|nr:hypothetical protein [Kordiimonas aquimaris]
MTDTILLVLTFTQIPVLFVIAARIAVAVNRHLAFKRNPVWVSENPSFRSHLFFERTAVSLSYMSAIVLFVTYVHLTIVASQSSLLLMMFIGPIVYWSVSCVLYLVLFHFFVTRNIPLPKKRSASTEDRRLSAYVPVWSVYVSYICLLSIMAVYAFALSAGSLIVGLAIARLSGLAVVLIIGTVMLLVVLRRKHSEMELIIGSNGRKFEVIGCILVLYLGVFTGIFRILGDFYEVSLFSDTSFFIVMSILIQGWFIGMSMHAKIKDIMRGFSRQKTA